MSSPILCFSLLSHGAYFVTSTNHRYRSTLDSWMGRCTYGDGVRRDMTRTTFSSPNTPITVGVSLE